MVLTDIATGWTECIPVRTRDSGNVIMAIKQARSRFPFPLLAVDFDNDSAFMNALVTSWCRGEDLEVTRSPLIERTTKRMWSRRTAPSCAAWWARAFVGMDATAALDRLYALVRLNANLFQPSFKLQEKTRIGASVIKPCRNVGACETPFFEIGTRRDEFQERGSPGDPTQTTHS
ncbi:hypothetical protein [Mesorhizobium sp.]|uniref:hypothetical protein n=1 Tax=Mesorhizobium sp. TaxID=1871066 RepID=UPI0025F36F33|nr:hypothetical protein [Mesorhizobium sp.]